MASTSYSPYLHFLFIFAFLARLTLAGIPPSLPLLPPADSLYHSPAPASSPAPAISSTPAPPPADLAPNSVPAPRKQSPSLTPASAVAGDTRCEADPNAADLETRKESSGGMNGGRKAGVAIGVVTGACVVGVGVLVYKRRQQNIRRSRYGAGGIHLM